jgi:hypothetical protein
VLKAKAVGTMNASEVRGGKNIRVSNQDRPPAEANKPAVKKKSRRTNRPPIAFGRLAGGDQPVALSMSRLSLGRISRLTRARGPSVNRMLARGTAQRNPELDIFTLFIERVGGSTPRYMSRGCKYDIQRAVASRTNAGRSSCNRALSRMGTVCTSNPACWQQSLMRGSW